MLLNIFKVLFPKVAILQVTSHKDKRFILRTYQNKHHLDTNIQGNDHTNKKT